MKVAIMQPYFLPYIGYFQLIAAADVFVIYDNIKYTKKGWINRNRYLLNGSDATFSIPLAAASDSYSVIERSLSPSFNRDTLLRQLIGAYARAPQLAPTRALLEQIVSFPDDNLFAYIRHAVQRICEHIGIRTPIVVSSTVAADHQARGQDKVLSICQALGASTYINAIGGTELYGEEAFAAHGMTLRFLQSQPFNYAQFGQPFVPWLSIIDVLMFNPPEVVLNQVTSGYTLVRGAA